MMLVFIVAFQPANSHTNQPVAVAHPNDLNTAPGVSMPLLTLDPTRGSMVAYGTGTVSSPPPWDLAHQVQTVDLITRAHSWHFAVVIVPSLGD